MHMMSLAKVWVMRIKMYRMYKAKYAALEKFIGPRIPKSRISKIIDIDKLYYWNANYLHCGCIKTHFRVNRNKPHIINLFKMYVYATTAGTFPNFILTAILGFIGGVILCYLYFFMCLVIFDMSTWTTFYISAFLCIFLTLGMAFFEGIRCVVLSVLPEICTSRARAMLISFALILLISGPGSNILFNTKQLTETIHCTHEQVTAINHNLTELYKKPLRIIRNGIQQIIKTIKPIVQKMKSILVNIKESLINIAKSIKDSFNWLKFLKIKCHVKGTTAGEVCTKGMQQLMKPCTENVAEFLAWVCNPMGFFDLLCLPLRTFDIFCSAKDYIEENVFKVLKNKLKALGNYIKTMFYVGIEFHHSYDFKTNQSRKLKDIFKEVHASQERRLEFFLGIFHFMKMALGMYIVYVLLSAFIYRYRFFYQTRYDNRHINKFIIDLDVKRTSINRQTIFPLTAIEKDTYVSLLAWRLTSWEQAIFLRGSTYLIMACVKTAFILLIDIFLFFILSIVHNYGRISFYFGADKTILGVDGSGFLWGLYNALNGALNLFDIELRFDTKPCLPEPIPINWLIYERIAITLAFAGIMSILQPYALRFRNFVMSHYYPEVARRRAVWLYNHILQTRGVFSSYVRRTLVTRGALGLRSEKPDPYKWLITKFPRLYFFVPFRNLYKECMVCGYTNPKIRCVTPLCPGMYDKECFEELNNTCILCNMPQNFKGLDVSEEEDSDGDTDQSIGPQEDPPPWWKFWIQVGRNDTSVIEMEEGISNESAQPLPSSKPEDKNPKARDYFGEEWRRDDWASMDDFDIPAPDMYSWTRPLYTTTRPPNNIK